MFPGFRFIRLCVPVLPAIAFLVSCSTEVRPVDTPAEPNTAARDSVLAYHRSMVGEESQQIGDYIARHGWQMDTTSTGLRIMIYRKGSGARPAPGGMASIRYRVNLLTGDPIDSTSSGEPLTFEVGKRRVLNGLEEGIMMMTQGSAARLILPGHLAYGLLGDPGKVPVNSVLVYDVELVKVEPPKK